MVYKLDVLPKAEVDIKNAFVWYEEKENGLGVRFLNEVEEVLNYIGKNPKLFQVRRKGKFREAILAKFPYVIIYEIFEKTVVVYSVFATRLDPKKKLKK